MHETLSAAQRRQIVSQAAALLAAYTGSPKRAASRLGITVEDASGVAADALTEHEVDSAFPRALKVVEGIERVVDAL